MDSQVNLGLVELQPAGLLFLLILHSALKKYRMAHIEFAFSVAPIN